jgi:hypothetical protein
MGKMAHDFSVGEGAISKGGRRGVRRGFSHGVRAVMVAGFRADQPDRKVQVMAKSLDAEMAAIEAEERKLMERRKAHQQKVREAAIGTVEKAGLFKLPHDRLERIMTAVKTLGVDEVEKRLQASA